MDMARDPVRTKGQAEEGTPTHVPEAATERRGGERSSPARSGDAASGTSALDPEVPAKASRRAFTAEYKLRMVRAADACKKPGEIGALLRREGLYSSHLVMWRRQRDRGALTSMRARKRGRAPKEQNPLAQENQRLVRENERLTKRLSQAEHIIAVQKKVAEVLALLENEDERNA